jgi:hypothetical protein
MEFIEQPFAYSIQSRCINVVAISFFGKAATALQLLSLTEKSMLQVYNDFSGIID